VSASTWAAWRDRHRAQLATPAEALAAVRPTDTVAVASFSNTPYTLCRALAARHRELPGLRVEHMAALFPWAAAASDAFTVVTNYATAADREALNGGRMEYLPVSHWHADVPPAGLSPAPDVYLVPVSPPDASGHCSFGTGAWFSPLYCRSARRLIGEVHEDFIRTGGDSWAPVERFDRLVPAEEPTGTVATTARNEEEVAATEVICTLVAHELIRDRDTLQIGIGTVSSALALYLGHRHELGIQSEAITAGVPDLVRSGVVTGRHKVLHPGVVVGSFLVGLTADELAFVDGHPGFALYGFGATDDVTTLVHEPNLTAVNNALLVDLTGQVASEGIGAHVWSGVGGQAAFAIAAAYAPGGRAIFVLPSMHRTATGVRSRIVAELPPGTVVTVPRGFVDHVVTEHGIATLRGKTLRERIGELVAVAHPDFRAELRAEARRLHHL
jgi:4-hydroxybutyrate CoA-transferase